MGKRLKSESGVIPIIILLSGIGVVTLLFISGNFLFKDQLFPKPSPTPVLTSIAPITPSPTEVATPTPTPKLIAKPAISKPISNPGNSVSITGYNSGEIIVGPSESIKTINAGVAAAGSNFRIKIHAGTYPEQVEVNKSVALVSFGDGQVWVDGGNTRRVGIDITAPSVVIDGIGVKQTVAQGILIENLSSKNVTIQNSIIQDFDSDNSGEQLEAGIASYYGGSGIKILGNTILRRSSGSLTGGLSDGIWFKSNTANQSGGGHLISGNIIKGGFDGIGGEEEGDPHGSFDKDTVIENNTIDTCFDDGIQSDGGNQNVRIRHNNIQRCGMGISNNPNLTGPVYIEYNRITNGVRGYYDDIGCFKIGGSGKAVANYTGNICILTDAGGDGWKQTNSELNAIVSRNNKIQVSRYVLEQTSWTEDSQRAGSSFDNDCLFTTDNTGRFIKWNGEQVKSLADWKAATGFEANGSQTQNCGDPK